MKDAVTKVIDTLTQEDIHGAFQKLSKRYNKCITAGGNYFEGDLSFMCVLSIIVTIRKKSGNLFNDPHTFKAENHFFPFVSETNGMINWMVVNFISMKAKSVLRYLKP